MPNGRGIAALLVAAFIVLAAVGTSTRGVIAEEVQPYLRRHTLVLEGRECAGPLPTPPYEPDAPTGPRWFATSSWPIVAYDGANRMWPVLVRGHQSAIATYVGIALGPLLGGTVAGVRRSTILLGCLVIVLTAAVARRTGRASALWATGLLATSFGMILSSRTGYGFEVGSRAAMMASLACLAPRRPPGHGRAALAGVAAAIAIASRATIGAALVPAAAVLLWRRERRPPATELATFAGLALALPIAGFALVAAIQPLREGTAPLAGFPVAQVLLRAGSVPRHALLDLAWLGDPMSEWGPIALGERTFAGSLWLPAAVASAVVACAVVRVRRGLAEDGERMLLAATATTVVAGAILYGPGNQFQLALALEPLLALAVAEQITSLGRAPFARAPRMAMLVGAAAVAVRVQGTVRGMALDGREVNPMFSGVAQRGVVDRLRGLGVRGPELVTTAYNHAGVIEAWTEGGIAPVHAWPLFAVGDDDLRLASGWRAVLRSYRPRYLLLTEGPNLFESGGTDPAAIERTLDAVAASGGMTLRYERFATESGSPGWALVTVDGQMPPERVGEDPLCPNIHADTFGGVRVGDRVADCGVDSIVVLAQGAGALVEVTCATARVRLDVRPVEGSAPAPGHGSGWNVYYRNDDVRAMPAQRLAETAAALGDLFESRRPP